jgi:protocatechuate 3,4-dioxygenase beta subunit
MTTRSRRYLLLGTVTALVSGAAAAVMRPFGIGAPRGQALGAAEKRACVLTVEATEGPFWVSGAQELGDGNLNTATLEGVPIHVSGRVFAGPTGETPLADAEVEVWHADSTGNYHPNGNGPADGYQAEEIALRGFVRTAADGSYQFTSIYPGEYTGRARHFHFKVRAPGRPELTTQLIVPARPGDQLTFDTDDIAEGLPNCQLLTIDESASPARANFDFRV